MNWSLGRSWRKDKGRRMESDPFPQIGTLNGFLVPPLAMEREKKSSRQFGTDDRST